MAHRREYLNQLSLRIEPVVRQRAERALEMGMIEPEHYLKAALSLEPPPDVLRDGDIRMRIATVSVLSERGDAEAVAFLRQLTRDADEYVRTHAAQALEGIDERHRRAIHLMEERAAADPAAGSVWADLAQAHLRMARIKSDVPVLERHHVTQALAALAKAVQREERTEWLLLMAEAHELAGRWPEAEVTVRRVLEREPSQPRALVLLAGLAFRQRLYDQVRGCCRRLAAVPDLTPEVAELAAFWTGALEAGREV